MEVLNREMEQAKQHLEKQLNINDDVIERVRNNVKLHIRNSEPKKRTAVTKMAAAIVILIIIIGISPVVAKAISRYFYSGDTTLMSGGYVIHDGYYYVKTGETTKPELLDKQIGTITRIGDWSNKTGGRY